MCQGIGYCTPNVQKRSYVNVCWVWWDYMQYACMNRNSNKQNLLGQLSRHTLYPREQEYTLLNPQNKNAEQIKKCTMLVEKWQQNISSTINVNKIEPPTLQLIAHTKTEAFGSHKRNQYVFFFFGSSWWADGIIVLSNCNEMCFLSKTNGVNLPLMENIWFFWMEK